MTSIKKEYLGPISINVWEFVFTTSVEVFFKIVYLSFKIDLHEHHKEG